MLRAMQKKRRKKTMKCEPQKNKWIEEPENGGGRVVSDKRLGQKEKPFRYRQIVVDDALVDERDGTFG